MITICFTYFKSLCLANLEAALYSVRQQDLSRVEEIIIVDNNTDDDKNSILDVIDSMGFPVPSRLLSFKHGDPSKTHAWSTNVAVREAKTSWILFTRADYLLDFDLIKKFTAIIDTHAVDWNGFVVSNGCHLSDNIELCERTAWRSTGPYIFHGVEFDYTVIDAGVWMAKRDVFHYVHGLDETLTAWGHVQTHFQHKMFKAHVDFVRIPETLFWHPQHLAVRDMDHANQQIADAGIDLKEMWKRYEGVSPY